VTIARQTTVIPGSPYNRFSIRKKSLAKEKNKLQMGVRCQFLPMNNFRASNNWTAAEMWIFEAIVMHRTSLDGD
jgi:hypothetical protein